MSYGLCWTGGTPEDISVNFPNNLIKTDKTHTEKRSKINM